MSGMSRVHALLLVTAVALVGVAAAGCGGSAIGDTETSADAKAADAAPTAQAETPAEATTSGDATTAAEATTETATAADNATAWAAVDRGAQAFAAHLDQANQSVASCPTDAAAGADFDECMGKAYTAIADAATTLIGVLDGARSQMDGDCAAAVGELRSTVQAMASDHARAAKTTDWTSLDTLKARLGDDAQSYADAALAAAGACAA